MTSRRLTRYPVQIDQAAPGKLVRTRVRQVAGSPPDASRDAAARDAVPYLARTILPLATTLKPQSSYTIVAGDRLDNLAARLLGDPLLYWVLLEANNVSDPASLCAVPGRKIIVPAIVGQSNEPFDQPQASRRGTAAAPSDTTADGDESP